MATRREVDPTQTPLDPDVTQMQPPLSGTEDDDDNADDEKWDENEPPSRWARDTNDRRDELRLDDIEKDIDQKIGDEDAEADEEGSDNAD